ncbi:MAG: 8-oxo-dGTP diphosphatase [Candidatus Buchananbacteria bacterium]|nr:8-oxo-dGTP diphosphatase [Candidatus Buchananbacteria bacterium]
MIKKVSTLCLLREGERILLGYKKRGLGQGRWNGFGGKVIDGETIEQAAKRELLEEVNLVANSLEKFGVINFYFQHNDELHEVHIYRVIDYSGEIKESEEMKPQWFEIDQIPYDQMWDDDRVWYNYFFAGKKFRGEFTFKNFDQMIEHKIWETNDIN